MEFKSLPFRKSKSEREGPDAAEHVAPGIGNLIEQHGCVAEVTDRPFSWHSSDIAGKQSSSQQ